MFGVKSRLANALILRFVSYREEEVYALMQTISHSTRAFIVNSNGLPGFLLPFNIVNHLKAVEEAGNLEHAKKW